ncbi:MAG: NUDIX domain-containing protein [Chloroflexota bacterium]
MELDVRTALILRHPTEHQVLLLRRSPTKRLFPNLITGVGGKVELEQGEGLDLTASMWREFTEETTITPEDIQDARLRLSTVLSRDPLQVLLLWYTGRLTSLPADFSCTEGKLEFHPVAELPLAQMIPTAREAIPFILSLPNDEQRIHNGCFDADMRLITN